MLLQRYIDLALRLVLPVAMLVVTGCASSGGSAPAERGSQASGTRVGQQAAAVQHPEVPAEAQTLFEQAVAVMASGDFVEAELRLKEFLLQYPAYPGAHVNLAIIHGQNGNEKAA